MKACFVVINDNVDSVFDELDEADVDLHNPVLFDCPASITIRLEHTHIIIYYDNGITSSLLSSSIYTYTQRYMHIM